ncbi:MAG: hypothetical protein ABSD74_12875 [Rhizomicrobium sp.]|jgi:hypothetical protein
MNMRTWMVTAVVAALPGLASADNVVTYHNSLARHGVYSMSGLTVSAARAIHLDAGFHPNVQGHVYAQPLFWHPQGGRAVIIVATESNAVAALDAKTGATVWQKTFGNPVRVNELPCGNVDPEGITGTPVIDPSNGVLHFDALTNTSAGPRQLVYAVSLADGALVPGWPVDVQAELVKRGAHFDSRVQGERSALTLLNGNLYVTYGGKFGDCGDYRGTVVQVKTSPPKVSAVWQTRAKGGGIWAQGGAASDGASLFVTTGNTFDAQSFGDGEAIVRLRPGLALSPSTADFFAPANWKQLDDDDADLGGTEALPFRIGAARRVIAFGKDGNAYFVNGDRLGGIGGALEVVKESDHAIITAPAILETPDAAVISFANRGGCGTNTITMLKVAASGTTPISNVWCGAMLGRGAPIITTTDGSSNAIVWAVGAEGDNLLHGFDAADGHVVFSGGNTPMTGLHHFQTLIAAEGRLYIAADDRVYAFVLGAK